MRERGHVFDGNVAGAGLKAGMAYWCWGWICSCLTYVHVFGGQRVWKHLCHLCCILFGHHYVLVGRICHLPVWTETRTAWSALQDHSDARVVEHWSYGCTKQ